MDQITAVEVAMHAMEEREAARLRQIEAGRQQADRGKEGGRGHKKPFMMESSERVSATDTEAKGSTRTNIAKAIGVSEWQVQKALAVQKSDPELLKEVARGTGGRAKFTRFRPGPCGA
ncbi:MAG: hypothetical protein KJZ78_21880 [Bryobacteraceae bacterium]|nr:hypothetical protein [Bryobacteraceae bacterium]